MTPEECTTSEKRAMKCVIPPYHVTTDTTQHVYQFIFSYSITNNLFVYTTLKTTS